ncbi:MAG: excinuclease ABC subunit UvrC [Proteobacteria bacterium]|nr:excinuclease ABC subunit UvrC [Pseudomonadota bacterium]
MEKQNNPLSTGLAEKLAQLPPLPGVYVMKDRAGTVLYVGKAKRLKNRVRSYFQSSPDQPVKTRVLVGKVADIETIVTQSEKEALILENTLIKKYRPRFNVTFRDDKNYPYLRLSLDEDYPTLTIARQARPGRAQYFGPFASAQAVRETLKLINQIFPLRKCHTRRMQKKRPCIYYQLGQCPAPCCCMVDPSEYRNTVKEVQLFLQGRSREILTSLQKKMELESQSRHFEQAARTRDRIRALGKTLERQAMVSLDFTDRDVFSFYREEGGMEIVVLFIRSGRLSGSRSFSLHRLQLPDEEILSSFISQYYQEGKFIPREIILPLHLKDRGLLEEWLCETKGERVIISAPARGAKHALLKMAAQNAELLFRREAAEKQSSADILGLLQEKLGLKNYPSRIECADISNIMGTSAVGSLVLFEDGNPGKNGYRRFRIRTVQQADDYAMMYEVLTRHLARARAHGTLPDLIMVDGGKGQLGVLLKALQDTGISGVDAVALAKARGNVQGAAGDCRDEEKIFIPHRKDPLILAQRSPALHLLQRIRDEAHRFAITYHKHLKKTRDLTSPLQAIRGIGAKTAQKMLTHFGSMENVRRASRQELSALPFLSKKTASDVYDFFRRDNKSGGDPRQS